MATTVALRAVAHGRTPSTRPMLIRFAIAASLLAIALSCQGGLDALLLTGFQIESVTLDLFDNVFLKNFTLEAFERALQALAITNVDFSQRTHLSF